MLTVACKSDAAGVAEESSFIAAEESFYATAYPADPIPTGPDACGPQIPDPSVPDTCNTPVEQTDQPAPWGVQCLNDTGSSTPINITSCANLIPQLCANQWQHPDEWVWLTENGCSIGSFLPGPKLPGHAPWPQGAVCEQLIYASMIDSCEYSGYGYNLAAVNLRTLPDNSPQGGSGAAVNVGYGSYIVAGRQLRLRSDRTD